MTPNINTNLRMFDLVRYMRSALNRDKLITDNEYFWLCAEARWAESTRRLEDYVELREKLARMESALESIAAHDGPGFPHGTCAKIATEALKHRLP
jgi:hypothetical protein